MEPMLRTPPFGQDPEREGDFASGVAKIALGIFFGALLVWMAIELRARYELRHFMQITTPAIAHQNAQMREAQERRDRRAREVKLLQADQVRKAAERKRAAVEAHEHKEAAWQQFHQPAAECLTSTSVECGNAHIRARREFERRYAAGEL